MESSYGQFVDFPTNANNVPDLILSNDANIVSYVSPDGPIGTSDHVVIHFEVNCYCRLSVMLMVSVHYNWPMAYEAIELYYR